MPSQISVVLPVLINNTRQLSMTMKCLELARKTPLPFELVIVESVNQYLIDEADVYVWEREAVSCERSHNRGFKVANGDFIALLTNDVYVDNSWLESLLVCFDKKTDCGVSTIGSTQFNHVKEDKIEEGNWWSVCMTKREIFDKCGYYDERFIDSWCDTDLLVRIYKAGYKMYRNFNSIAEHLVGQTNYEKENFNINYEAGRKLFREKHDGCNLPIYEAVK